jgi:hypothetical protein
MDNMENQMQDGGAKKSPKKGTKKVVKKAEKYNKTDKQYKDKCNVVRKVYEKDGSMYIKKKSPKTGKFCFSKVKL